MEACARADRGKPSLCRATSDPSTTTTETHLSGHQPFFIIIFTAFMVFKCKQLWLAYSQIAPRDCAFIPELSLFSMLNGPKIVPPKIMPP